MQAAGTLGARALSKRLLALAVGVALVGMCAGGAVYFAGLIAKLTGTHPPVALLAIACLAFLFLGYCLHVVAALESKKELAQAKEDAYWDDQGAKAYQHYLECNSDNPPIEVAMDRNAARKRDAKKHAALVKELRGMPWHEDI